MSFQFGITFLVDGAENITVIVLIEIDIMTDFDEKGFLTEVILLRKDMISSEFFVFPERYFKNFICILLSMRSPVFDFLYKVSQKRGTGNSERRM